MMKVSLSWSFRQLRCMAYSSERERGSEAVSAWICCRLFSWCGKGVGSGDGRTYFILHPLVVGWYVRSFVGDK